MTKPFLIDVHAHIGMTRGFFPRFWSNDDMVRLMDKLGVEITIFSAMALLNTQFEIGYRETAEALEQHPTRFRAYTVFDPNWPDASLRWMEKHQFTPGYVGIKIHPAGHAVPPEDARYRELWAFADQHALPVLTHSWSPDPANPSQDLSTPDRFGEILAAHPRVKLILGHTGGRMVGYRMAAEIMRAFPHTCWADLSGDNFPDGLVEWLLTQVGEHQLLFGTDSNWIEPRYHVGWLLKTRITPEQKLKLLRDNALGLFGPTLLDPAAAPARHAPATSR